MSTALRTSYLQELTTLRSQLEADQSTRRKLEQDRDVAFEGLELLQRKIDEQRIAETAPQFSVRYVSAGIDPVAGRLMPLLLSTTLGFVFGLIASILLVLLLELVQRRSVAVPITGSTPAPVGDKPLTN
ncbi:hypothetical protein HC891_22500 [Candidatus Gracilibacteria bacterium]|nr:hypothetical protein [Candidatus Gracilibacteria bacterium]